MIGTAATFVTFGGSTVEVMRWGMGPALTACGTVVLGMLCACGDDKPSAWSGEDQPSSATSSPFTVGSVPDGFRGVLAGEGTTPPPWGYDTDWPAEPFTVISADGTKDGTDLTVVSFTSNAEDEGGFGVAAKGRWGADPIVELEIDGETAYFVKAFEDESGVRHWADLVVDQGDGLAIRLSGPDATVDELQALLPSVVVPDARDRAPVLEGALGQRRIVGSIDQAPVAIATSWPEVDPDRALLPGPPGSYSATWEREAGDDPEALQVFSLPGGSADLSLLSLVGYGPGRGYEQHSVEVADRPAAVLEWRSEEGEVLRRSVWALAPWGDVLTASARASVSTEELVDVLASVRPADAEAWAQFVDEMDGGPGFAPDHGHEEVARGTVEGIDWLLQTGRLGPTTYESGGTSRSPDPGVDGCLKLSTGASTCAAGTTMGLSAEAYGADDDGAAFGFLLFTTDEPVDAIQVVTVDGEEDPVPLVDIPDSDARVAVVFFEPGSAHRCDLPTRSGEVSIRALGPDGDDLGCAGFGPHGVLGGL